MEPTVYATEVEEVGSTVHLVELKAHLGLHGRDRVLPLHSQVVGVHHLCRGHMDGDGG